MTTSANYYALAQATPFADRCFFVAFQFALNFVVSEDPGTSNHTNRVALANKVVSDRLAHSILATAVLTDTGLQAKLGPDPNAVGVGDAITDQDMDGRLQAQWNALSNAGL